MIFLSFFSQYFKKFRKVIIYKIPYIFLKDLHNNLNLHRLGLIFYYYLFSLFNYYFIIIITFILNLFFTVPLSLIIFLISQFIHSILDL